MAVRNRTQLEGENQSQLPDNNEKLITPSNHRSVNTDMIDSTFNKLDDDSNDVGFNNSGTDLISGNVDAAIKELNSRIRPVLASGIVEIGNILVGSVGETRQIISGSFTSAFISRRDRNGAGYRIQFPDVGTTNYIPIVTMENFILDTDTGVTFEMAVESISSTAFTLFLRETLTREQNLRARIILFGL